MLFQKTMHNFRLIFHEEMENYAKMSKSAQFRKRHLLKKFFAKLKQNQKVAIFKDEDQILAEAYLKNQLNPKFIQQLTGLYK